MKSIKFGDKNLPSSCRYMAVAKFWQELSSSSTDLVRRMCYLPNLNGHGEEYQHDYVSTEDSALRLTISKRIVVESCLIMFRLAVRTLWSFCP